MRTKVHLIAVFVLALSVLLAGIPAAAEKSVADTEISIRKQSLFEEKSVTPDMGKYPSDSPGASKKIERSFENSPPLIPHDVSGMLPITINSNQCLGCHMPDAAKNIGAVPIPRTHLDKKGKELRGKKFACMLCHAPQAEIPATVDNTFEKEFRNKKSKYRSNLSENQNEGVK